MTGGSRAGRLVPALATGLSRALVSGLVVLLLCSLVPVAFGGRSQVVATGSMTPALVPGDVAVSWPVGTPVVGQIVVADNPLRPGRTLTHRVVEVRADGSVITRGDANATDDSTPIEASAIHGRLLLRIPYLGLPVVWASHRQWLPLGLLAGAALLALANLRRPRPALAPAETPPADDVDADPEDTPADGTATDDPDPTTTRTRRRLLPRPRRASDPMRHRAEADDPSALLPIDRLVGDSPDDRLLTDEMADDRADEWVPVWSPDDRED